MLVFVLRRLVWMPILLALVALITFGLGLYGPGDPIVTMLGQHANPEAVARLKRDLGLDRPFPVQYATYIYNVLQGDFGRSLSVARGRPVIDLFRQCLGVTIQLNLGAIAFGTLVGVPLGVVAALRRNRLLDRAIVALVVAGISVPVFVLIPVLLLVLAVKTHLLPPGGWNGLLSKTAILPVFVLGLGPVAVLARQMRSSMIEAMGAEYVLTARAKGLAEQLVVARHALRNALIPIATIFGFMLAGLVGGSFFTELLLGIPGCGRLAFRAFSARDYPVINAFILLVAVAYTVANLVVDISYGFLDPRIRRRE